MSGLGNNVFINPERAFWLREIPPDVQHSTIVVQELDASIARISTATIDDLTVSSAQFSTFGVQNLDVSGMYVSSIRGNTAFFSSMSFASDLSGGVGYVRFSVDASGIQVDGDPIRFDNLVYLTSTINIVNVSTIVDTDIFAKNGYFSTISTGNLSVNQAYINKAFISSLEVSDLSGFSERSWSLYPTLSGEIIMSTGYNLSNVGSNLFFAGQQLATPADISGIDTWSYHPAISSLKMNNQIITGLSTINFQDSATLTSQTGNNLFYNGQPIQYGATSNVNQWANYPAVNTVQLSNSGITATGNIPIAATSNVSITAQRFSTVVDGGADVGTFADLNLTAQNGNRGRINLTANGGFNNGVNGEVNVVANGNTLLGVGTGGLVTITANTPLATPSNLTSAIKLSASGINSYAGAIPSIGSLAGYNFIYGTGGVNIVAGPIPSVIPNTPFTTYLYGSAGVVSGSDFYVPNIYPYWNGLTTPPDLLISGRYIVPNLAQVYVQLSNVKNIYMDGGAQILNARYISTVSSVANNLTVQNLITTSNLNYTFAAGNSNLVGNLLVGNVQATLSNSQILGFSNVSSVNVNLSTINGIPLAEIQTASNITCSNITVSQSTATSTLIVGQWGQISTLLFNNILLGLSSSVLQQRTRWLEITESIVGKSASPGLADVVLTNFSSVNAYNISTVDLWTSTINGLPYVPGGGGSSTVVSSFSNLFASSISGYGGLGLNINGPLTFFGGNAIDKVDVINLNPPQIPLMVIGASTMILDTNNVLTTSISTQNLNASYIITSTITANPPYTGEIFFDGQLRPLNNIIVLYNNNILFQDSTGTAPQLINMKPLASIEMPVVTNSYGNFQSNLGSLGANSFYVGGGYGPYGGAKFYSAFPGTAWAIDIMDADGATLFESINSYDVGGFNFQTNIYGVSSISGYTPISPGLSSSVTFDTDFVVAPCISTNSIIVSTINGAPVDGSSFDNQFSTLYVSSLNFSTAVSIGSNTAFNYPIIVDYDQAGNTTTAGVAIAVQGHNFGSGAVVNRIEMGARASGENYIMSVWPGQNLEELFIDATDLTIRDGVFSTIINLDPFGLQTTGGIKGPFVSTLALNVSSINDTDANRAFTNNLQLSTMTLYTGSTTLAYWDSVTTSSNVNTTGYDTVVGKNGTYKVGFSFQGINTGGTDDMSFFFLKNDVAIPNSATYTLIKNNELITSYAEILEPLLNGDKIQVGYYTTGANVQVSTITGVTPAGDAPAGILTVYKID